MNDLRMTRTTTRSTKRSTTVVIAFALIVLSLAPGARGQVPPPIFGGGVGLFDPEIDTLNVGAVLDAQVVVSEDRRYVTINARPSNSRLIALQQFTVSGTTVGFVGGGGDVGTGAGAAPDANRGSAVKPGAKAAIPPDRDVEPIMPAGVLGRRGIFQLTTLPPARK